MGEMSLPQLAEKMKDIDFVMMSTRRNGEIAARPMSNNRDVEYDGDSYFFSLEENPVIADLEAEPKVGLTVQGNKGLLGKPGIFVAIEGDAQLIRDKAQFQEHWTNDMDRWAENGPETPGLVLIKVHASRIHYWDGEDEGELRL